MATIHEDVTNAMKDLPEWFYTRDVASHAACSERSTPVISNKLRAMHQQTELLGKRVMRGDAPFWMFKVNPDFGKVVADVGNIYTAELCRVWPSPVKLPRGKPRTIKLTPRR